MTSVDPESAATRPGLGAVAGGVALTVVGGVAAWLATFWALSQAAAVFSAGRAAEGWTLAARPVLIPLGMVMTWLLVRRSTGGRWSHAVRVLGIGAAISVMLPLLDAFVSAGF